jgi:hypothetical protein
VAATATEGAWTAVAAAAASEGDGAVAGAGACVATATFCSVAAREPASSASASWWDPQRRGEHSSRTGPLSSRRCGEGGGIGGGGACVAPFVGMAAVKVWWADLKAPGERVPRAA